MDTESSSAQAGLRSLTSEQLEKCLQEYARLLIARGVVLREGQTLIIQAPVEAYEFTRLVVEAAFAAGAADVSVRWGDTPCGETRLRYASLETLKTVPEWLADSFNSYAREDVAWLALDTEFPPPTGLDLEKVGAARVASIQATKPFMDARMTGVVHWNIASVATVPWASLVYPNLPADEGLAALWHDVLLCSRCLSGEPGAAIAAWDKHIAVNDAYRDKLNDAEFSELHFASASTGTDLRLGLPTGYRFVSSQGSDAQGRHFIPNIPSEEIFAGPDRLRVNGRVVASKPLFYNNVLVEGLWFDFEDGKAVRYGADSDEGRDIIARLLATDEGSSYLGEVALVPWDSTVSNTGRLFFTTLYDENAACHLALGESYPDTLDGGLDMTKEELAAAGMNQSLEHVDFMFGTADMSIVGTRADGSELAVFKDGNWVL